MKIATMGQALSEAVERDPIPGVWYHGQTAAGAGALVQYVGWNRFVDADDNDHDMTRYPVLVEHVKQPA